MALPRNKAWISGRAYYLRYSFYLIIMFPISSRTRTVNVSIPLRSAFNRLLLSFVLEYTGASILVLVDLAREFLNVWKIVIKAIANSVNSMTNFLEKSVTTGLSTLA